MVMIWDGLGFDNSIPIQFLKYDTNMNQILSYYIFGIKIETNLDLSKSNPIQIVPSVPLN